ncbi:MAG: selenium-dependent xanthine dehydrogenase [Clostridia bacterium]|jgi:aldehyde oxidoreductase|nr:selenium-dependent xanthine dehydrogenase [Clostridia bacterium]MBT7123114.1 selenium-dependent xanthine dehydrogenase [Clostridia bacterium]
MSAFYLNDNLIETNVDKCLLRFLRDDMHIKSVKDGCSEGACGACSVLINGVSKRACLQRTQKLDGKRIVTVEGLSDYEKQVYTFCFSKAGAVQCGFCTPGMVISAKALLDQNKSPSVKEIAKALRGNICRCTGYTKIIEAVQMAAQMLRDETQIPAQPISTGVMSEVFRPSAYAKTMGTGVYTDDIELPDMAYASAVRSRHPRAVVEEIDISRASAHKDTIAVLTAADIPGNVKAGHIVKDWDTLIAKGQTTRYIGDAIVLVISRVEQSLQQIKSLVRIKYTVLEPITNPQAALAKGAPMIHESGNVLRHDHIVRGAPIDEVIARSVHTVTQTYETPFTEHAYLEPECAVCTSDGESVTIYTGGQNIYDEQREIAHILGIDKDKVHVITKLVGGAFGGKEDMSVQHHAALASFVTERTVKVKLTRRESIRVSTKRHAMRIELSTGCDAHGRLTGIKANIIADTGAYASLGGPVTQRACTHAGGPYKYDSVDIESRAVYTNNPPAGAFRGFGVPQSCFAIESNINLLAQKVGISPWEIRYLNAVEQGDELPNGQIADESTALKECLLALKDKYENNEIAGIAAAFKNTGLGVGVPDVGRAIVSVQNGKVHVRTGAARVGQGLDSVVLQIACQTLGFTSDIVVVEQPDTLRTPNSGTTTASRQTVFAGEAVRIACSKLRKQLDDGKSLENLDGEEFYGEFECVTDPIINDKENPKSHLAYSYGAQVVVLDDNGKVTNVYSAYDIGQVINHSNALGQMQGGIVMALGYALTEDFPLDECVPQAKFGTLGLMRSTAVPQMDTQFLHSRELSSIAYGAKGVGEISSIPTAPAVSGAYYKKDGIFRTRLPLEQTAYRKQDK